MGQKVHPIGMRVGIIRDWDAKWYAEKEYADYLHEDLAIRKFIQKELADAAVSTIEIERAVNKVNVSLHTAKPGMVIGKGGAKGIKTQVSGRLNGADIARAEGYSEGTVPLHTLRADIDYAWEEADTTYGKLGVKVWIYRGEVLPARKDAKGGK